MVEQFSEGLALFLDVLSWKLPSSSLLRVSPLGLFTDRRFSEALGGFCAPPRNQIRPLNGLQFPLQLVVVV